MTRRFAAMPSAPVQAPGLVAATGPGETACDVEPCEPRPDRLWRELDGTLERFLRLPFTLPAAELVEAVGRIASVRYDLDRGNRMRWPEPAVIA